MDDPNIRRPLADTTQTEAHPLSGRKQKRGWEHKHLKDLEVRTRCRGPLVARARQSKHQGLKGHVIPEEKGEQPAEARQTDISLKPDRQT